MAHEKTGSKSVVPRADFPPLPGSAEWAELGILAAAPLLHELRNKLNIIALQTRILARSSDENQGDSVVILTRAVAEASAALEWIQQRREAIEAIEADFDFARELHARLAALEAGAAQSGRTLAVRLHAPTESRLRVRSPHELRQWLSYLLRDAIRWADGCDDVLDLGLEITDAGARLTIRLGPAAQGSSEEPTCLLAVPAEPLHALERGQLDAIPRRLRLELRGRLDSCAAELIVTFPSLPAADAGSNPSHSVDVGRSWTASDSSDP